MASNGQRPESDGLTDDGFEGLFDETPTPSDQPSGVRSSGPSRFPPSLPRSPLPSRVSYTPPEARGSMVPPEISVLLPKAKLLDKGYSKEVIQSLETFCATLNQALLRNTRYVLDYSLSKIVEVICDQKGVLDFDKFLTILEATILRYLKVNRDGRPESADRSDIAAFRTEYSVLRGSLLYPPRTVSVPELSEGVAARVSHVVPFVPKDQRASFSIPEKVLTHPDIHLPAAMVPDQKDDIRTARSAFKRSDEEKTLNSRLDAHYAALAAGVHQKPFYQPSAPVVPPKKPWWKRAVDFVRRAA